MKNLALPSVLVLLASLAIAACRAESPTIPTAAVAGNTTVDAAVRGGNGRGGGGGGSAPMMMLTGGITSDWVPVLVERNNKKRLDITGELIEVSFNFGEPDPGNCDDNGGVIEQALLDTFSLQNTTRGLGISIDKPSETGNILSLPAVENDPVNDEENWLSLCFSTGGFCKVTVIENEALGTSTITFHGGPSVLYGDSRVRVVDDVENTRDHTVLVCPNGLDVVIDVKPSLGWTTSLPPG